MKMPQAWAKPVQVQASVEVKAEIDMSAEVAGQGLCPDCKAPMQEVLVDGKPVLACMSDRIVLLPKNDETPPQV